IGGKSMGGRVASLLLDELAPAGAVIGGICLGYPFHPPGRPHQLRTEHLVRLQTPALILQGERDPFGRPDEVAGYGLSPQVQLQWIPHGDHSFKPSRSAGLSESGNRELAVQHVDRFCRQQLSR
ncbi:MAG: alpha/beta family hydrolase, partial [Cyanobium sp.]